MPLEKGTIFVCNRKFHMSASLIVLPLILEKPVKKRSEESYQHQYEYADLQANLLKPYL